MSEQNRYETEETKIGQFRHEVMSIIDELSRKVLEEVQEELKTAMPWIREVAGRAADTLKAYVKIAPFDDADLKAALDESFERLPDLMEMFIDVGVTRAVKKTFESIRLDIDETLKRLGLPIENHG